MERSYKVSVWVHFKEWSNLVWYSNTISIVPLYFSHSIESSSLNSYKHLLCDAWPFTWTNHESQRQTHILFRETPLLAGIVPSATVETPQLWTYITNTVPTPDPRPRLSSKLLHNPFLDQSSIFIVAHTPSPNSGDAHSKPLAHARSVELLLPHSVSWDEG